MTQRQKKLSQNIIFSKQGFTIVELLIVVVVIAILAAITIVAFNGISKRATESSMQADLHNAATAVNLDNARNGSYPDSASSVNEGNGLKASGNNTIAYNRTSYGFCITVENSTIAEQLRYRSDNKQIEAGGCTSTASVWTLHSVPEQNTWRSVAYGSGRFVAVASDGTNRIMTSTDGASWAAIAAPEQNSWASIAYGGGRFVAVASSGTNRIMTSTDGLSWTAVASPQQDGWSSVTYGDGQFMAVGRRFGSAISRVMTSSNGTSWTINGAVEQDGWGSVTHGGGRFVAVKSSSSYADIMTSTNGTSWTSSVAPERNRWNAVAYGAGRFVAVADNGVNRIMTSTDGSSWSVQAAPEQLSWQTITFGGDRFVAGATSGKGLMVSTDGLSWEAMTPPIIPSSGSSNNVVSLGYGNGCFVGLAVTPGNSRNVIRSCE